MSIKTKLFGVALAALAVTGSIVSTTSQAEAKPPIGLVFGAGLATAAIVGTAVAASQDPYYGYHRCGWAAQYNAFGQYVGRVRTCY